MCSFITTVELRAIGYCQVGVPARLDTELAQTEAKGLDLSLEPCAPVQARVGWGAESLGAAGCPLGSDGC